MESILSTIMIQALHGLVYAMLLFLVASGFSLVYGMMGVLNIAHPSFYMLGAYFGYTVFTHTGNFWLALILAPIFTGLIGVLIERFFLRKVHIYGHAFELLITLGIFYISTEVVKWIWGNYPLPLMVPSALSGSLLIMGFTYPVYRFFILLVSFIVLAILIYLFSRTRIGITIRAAASDVEMVNALGKNVPRLFLWIFCVGSAMAGLAGVITGPFLSTYPGMAHDMLFDLFVLVIVGGLGSLGGSFLASLLLGELQSFGILLIPQFALVFQFLLMAVVLIIKPSGLFGEKV